MEDVLRAHLIKCFAAFLAQSRMQPATVAARASGDWRFFDRLADRNKTFTARKYDEVLQWFSENWPENTNWPAGVPRPLQLSVE